jgi:hypothetical protein
MYRRNIKQQMNYSSSTLMKQWVIVVMAIEDKSQHRYEWSSNIVDKCMVSTWEYLGCRHARRGEGEGVSLPILLVTDVQLRFSKHPHSYIQCFWKPYPFIYSRWKSWPNNIFHNNIVNFLYIVAACANSAHCCCNITGDHLEIKI